MQKIELRTDDPASHRCGNCGRTDRQVVLIVGQSFYCGDNCAQHQAARNIASDLSYSIAESRGGSPLAVETAERLLECLKRLNPTQQSEHDCPRCWRPMPSHYMAGEVHYRCTYIHPPIAREART